MLRRDNRRSISCLLERNSTSGLSTSLSWTQDVVWMDSNAEKCRPVGNACLPGFREPGHAPTGGRKPAAIQIGNAVTRRRACGSNGVGTFPPGQFRNVGLGTRRLWANAGPAFFRKLEHIPYPVVTRAKWIAHFYDTLGETNCRCSLDADHGAVRLSTLVYVWPSGQGGRLGSDLPRLDPHTPSSGLALPIFAKINLRNDLRTDPAGHSASGPGCRLHKCGFLVPLHPRGG